MKPADVQNFEKKLSRKKNPLKKLLKFVLKLFDARQVGILYGTNQTKAKFLPTHVWDRGIMDGFDGVGFAGLFLKMFGKQIVSAKKLSPVYFLKEDSKGQMVDNDGMIAHILRNSSDYYEKGIRVIFCLDLKKYIHSSSQQYVGVPYFSYDGNCIEQSCDRIKVDTRIINQFNSNNSIYIYLPDYGILVINTANEALMETNETGFVQEKELKSRMDILTNLVEVSSLAYLGKVPGKKRAQFLWQKERRLRKAMSELIKNGERYRELYENAPIAYISLDTEGRILRCNNKTSLLLGHDKQKLAGQKLEKFLWKMPDRFNLPISIIDRIIDADQIRDLEWQIMACDEKPVWVSASVDLIKDDSGELKEFRMMLMDISKRKILEKQLLFSQKMEAMGSLAGGIAHDFNNVLFLISGYTELLLMETAEDDPMKNNLDVIMDCVMHARELVNQILIISRQNSGELKILDIKEILKESLILVSSFLPATIKVKVDIDTPCGQIFADPVQIHQVIIHLVTNAYHAMEEEGGTLFIDLNPESYQADGSYRRPGQQDKKYICFSVRDTGTGIDVEILDKIFDPYFTSGKEQKGSGVGLSVVQGIVETCGGYITVDTQLRKGTRFNVYFPEYQLDP